MVLLKIAGSKLYKGIIFPISFRNALNSNGLIVSFHVNFIKEDTVISGCEGENPHGVEPMYVEFLLSVSIQQNRAYRYEFLELFTL